MRAWGKAAGLLGGFLGALRGIFGCLLPSGSFDLVSYGAGATRRTRGEGR